MDTNANNDTISSNSSASTNNTISNPRNTTNRNHNEYQQQITPLSPSIHPRYINDDQQTINQFQLPKSISLPPDDFNFGDFQPNLSCMFMYPS